MQAIMETSFDVCYLLSVIAMGIWMVKHAQHKQIRLFGWMAIILGGGDAFHLIPRAYALCTNGLAAHAAALGIGKLVTSITMTIFYVLLYYVWKLRYHKDTKGLTTTVYGLAIARVILCLFPQNEWLSYQAPLSWGIYRNIPFTLFGLLIIYLFYTEAKRSKDHAFCFMWLAITLSFGFYLPVVLYADRYPLLGMLMIPKTLAYVWVVWMGFKEARRKV